MKYALLIYQEPGAFEALSEAEQRQVHAEYMALRDVPGVYAGDQLRLPETATTIRVSGGQTLATDGPFADTKEFFGGYYLVEADDIETPLAIAARIPAARMGGAVEVRPLVELPPRA